jgi:hypothetical protein
MRRTDLISTLSDKIYNDVTFALDEYIAKETSEIVSIDSSYRFLEGGTVTNL